MFVDVVSVIVLAVVVVNVVVVVATVVVVVVVVVVTIQEYVRWVVAFAKIGHHWIRCRRPSVVESEISKNCIQRVVLQS